MLLQKYISDSALVGNCRVSTVFRKVWEVGFHGINLKDVQSLVEGTLFITRLAFPKVRFGVVIGVRRWCEVGGMRVVMWL